MSDIPHTTGDVTLYNETGDKVAVIQDGSIYRLAVDANITNTTNKGKFISEFLKNGTNKNMSVNGSGTPVQFSASPPTGKIWYISRLITFMEDNSMGWQKFGGISTLTNGVGLEYSEGGITADLLDGEFLITNSSFVQFAYDAEINSASSDILRSRWTFAKSGTFLQLNALNSDFFRATVNDKLTAISDFRMLIQGYEVDE